MPEHFKQNLEEMGFHTPPYPSPASQSGLIICIGRFGKIGTKDRKRGEGGKAIFSGLKIADFPETLDSTPKAGSTHVVRIA